MNDLNYVKMKIEENREKSIKMRAEIREYALNKFSLEKLVNDYIINYIL